MIPVSTAPPTPDIIAQLNKLALEGLTGSSRFKKPSSAKRRTTRRAK